MIEVAEKLVCATETFIAKDVENSKDFCFPNIILISNTKI